MLSFDMCKWQVEEGDIEGVHGAIVDHRSFFISMPLRRPQALYSPVLHRLVQLGVREVQVTSIGLSHITL